MSVIDSAPPSRRGCNIGAASRSRTGESIRLRATMPAKTDTHDCCPTREHRYQHQLQIQATPAAAKLQARLRKRCWPGRSTSSDAAQRAAT